MQLKELLEHLVTEVLQDRPAVVSGPSKNLWSDATAVRYFNQAEQMFARKTYCIVDSSSSVASVTLTAGVETYTLDKSIIKVLNARMSDATLDLGQITHDRIQGSQWALATTDWLTQVANISSSPARPLVWTMDEGTRVLRVYPAPDAAAAVNTLKLRVIRMPTTALSTSALTAEPQIPEEYHLNLCDWVAYRALTHQDVDGNNRKEANSFRDEFMQSIKSARAEIKRLTQPDGRIQFSGWGNG